MCYTPMSLAFGAEFVSQMYNSKILPFTDPCIEERRPLSVYIRFPRVIHCHCVKVFYIACQSTLK